MTNDAGEGGPAQTAERQGMLDWSIQPPYLYTPYRSTVTRSPQRPLVPLAHNLSDVTGPVYGENAVTELDSDLTRNAVEGGEPLGQRIVVTGRVLDEAGRPVRRTLVEVWQANAAGRYTHKRDQHGAPLDPNFHGGGRCLTDDDGNYRFVSIKPGAYPWRNHLNAWRPQHIHFSVFGRNFHQRLVTQMYFPGDPLLPFDPIYNGIPDEGARKRLVSHFDLDITEPEWALGFRFDIVLAGPLQTPFEREH